MEHQNLGWDKVNLFGILDATARRYGDEGAVYLGTEQFATYSELRRVALCLAGGLSTHARPGDRILIASKNTPLLLPIIFGTWAAGMVAVPVNAKLHPAEIMRIVEDCEPAFLFVSREIGTELFEILPQRLRSRMCILGSNDYQALTSAKAVSPVRVQQDDLAWLFYTSGTTGRSKGAMLTHRNLRAMAIAHLADFEDISPTDCLLHAAPMSHGSGLYILPYVMRGGRHVIPESAGFDVGEILDLAQHHSNCGAFLAPTMLRRLRVAVEQSDRKPSGLRSIIYGGGPMYQDEIQKALATFGPIFQQLYGQGEAPMTITGLRLHDHLDPALLRTVGWPRSGVEVDVVDSKRRSMPAGKVGEIVCRGDVVMAGYWGHLGAGDVLRDGWLYTGDMGAMDDRGCLTLHDRSKDVIISGGSNIYPREVEEALLTHADVAEVSVLGKPDEEWGETVIAFVVPELGRTICPEALDAHCLSAIARFKRPKEYIFLSSLPKNSYGKILKRKLAKQLTH